MSKLKVLITLIILGLIGVGGAVGYFGYLFYEPYSGNATTFTVERGDNFPAINGRLVRAGIIKSPRIFHRYTQYKQKMTSFKFGTYEIPAGASMEKVLEILTEGVPILAKLTIPEGKNLYEVAKILEAKDIAPAKEFIKLCKDKNLVKRLVGVEAPSLEGYLFPDTYMLPPEVTAKQVIEIMISEFKRKTKELDFSKSHLNNHEVIILASIVEKETGAAWERPTIAGVYLNRLKKRMRLQADPTTIYGIWETYNGNLRKKHLLEKTPYNTYKISGLPLGPIANPSLAAIEAVLEPKEHDFIFFVSKNDGTHVFTSNYKDHNKAVDFWQRNRKNRQGKSWRDLKQN